MAYLVATPEKIRYRCTNGHEWKTTGFGGPYGTPDFFAIEGDGEYCARCYADHLRSVLGKVTRVESEVKSE